MKNLFNNQDLEKENLNLKEQIKNILKELDNEKEKVLKCNSSIKSLKSIVDNLKNEIRIRTSIIDDKEDMINEVRLELMDTKNENKKIIDDLNNSSKTINIDKPINKVKLINANIPINYIMSDCISAISDIKNNRFEIYLKYKICNVEKIIINDVDLDYYNKILKIL